MTTPPKGFLSLPRELRDQIYTQLVEKRHNIITMAEVHRHRWNEISAAQPAISRVNKQIRAEVLPLFYARNMFFANPTSREQVEMTEKWLRAVGDAHLGCLKSLMLQGQSVLHTWGGCKGSFSQPIRSRANFEAKVCFDLVRGELEDKGEPDPFMAKWSKRREEKERMKRKAMSKLRDFYHRMLEETRREGKELDVESLSALVDFFHELCWDEYLGESPTPWPHDW